MACQSSSERQPNQKIRATVCYFVVSHAPFSTTMSPSCHKLTFPVQIPGNVTSKYLQHQGMSTDITCISSKIQAGRRIRVCGQRYGPDEAMETRLKWTRIHDRTTRRTNSCDRTRTSICDRMDIRDWTKTKTPIE